VFHAERNKRWRSSCSRSLSSFRRSNNKVYALCNGRTNERTNERASICVSPIAISLSLSLWARRDRKTFRCCDFLPSRRNCSIFRTALQAPCTAVTEDTAGGGRAAVHGRRTRADVVQMTLASY